MSDFSPATRNASWWSGDSRLAARGKANEAILIKQGKLVPEDISDVEAVKMGHVMEPVIGRLAQDKLGIELTKIEDAYDHPKETWLKSHFDFAGQKDGKTILVEAKNYNAAMRNKFDPDTGLMPSADLAQCIHEATVFGCETVVLAVLLGGQEFITIPVEVSEEMKLEHIKQCAVYWGYVQSGNTMPPESTEQARLIYKVSQEGQKMASASVEQVAAALVQIKAQIKALEATEESYATMLQGYMAEQDTLVTIDGRVIATWKSAKASKSFDSKLFQQSMPEIYNKYVVDKLGSRRFLLK
jgi:predicted phage-related endonuclease